MSNDTYKVYVVLNDGYFCDFDNKCTCVFGDNNSSLLFFRDENGDTLAIIPISNIYFVCSNKVSLGWKKAFVPTKQDDDMAQKRIESCWVLNGRIRILYDDGTKEEIAAPFDKMNSIIRPESLVGLTLDQAKLYLGIKS